MSIDIIGLLKSGKKLCREDRDNIVDYIERLKREADIAETIREGFRKLAQPQIQLIPVPTPAPVQPPWNVQGGVRRDPVWEPTVICQDSGNWESLTSSQQVLVKGPR